MLVNTCMRWLAWVVLMGAAAPAQQFEVATVRLSPDVRPMMSSTGLRDGRFSERFFTLKELLIQAYSNVQVSGPDWIASTRYDIDATAPAGSKPSDLPAMLRSLLAERLGVVVHKETAERNVYALEVVRGGPKLAAFDPAKPPQFPSGASFMILSGTLDNWCDLLARLVDRPVVNRTGVKGDYFHVFTYATADPAQPSLFTALQEQTGLRLAPGRAVIETVVVDRAERVPADN